MAGNYEAEEHLRNKREAAAYLGVSVGSLERLMRAGLPYIKFTGSVRFDIHDLADFVESRRVRRSGGAA